MFPTIVGRSVVMILLSLALFISGTIHYAAAYDASNLFRQLKGSWRGSGTLTLADGGRERISCRGYYVLKAAGNGLGLAILCESPERKVEVRGRVEKSRRGVTGRWEERTFNAMGTLSGKVIGSRMQLRIAGRVEGAISIALRGRRQSVKITTSGTGFTRVSISLVRG